MKVKNFIWDFDGTILDTYPHSATACLSTLKKYGIEADYDEVISLLRDSFSSIIPRYNLSKQQFAEVMNAALVLWFEPNPTVYEGIDEVLKTVVERGGKNFIYTNRDKTSKQYLEHFGLLKYFTDFVCNDTEGYAHKPSGESIEYLLSKYSLSKDSAVMVGDRELDVLCGEKAGIKSILFDEFHKSENTVADAVIYDIRDVLNFIE